MKIRKLPTPITKGLKKADTREKYSLLGQVLLPTEVNWSKNVNSNCLQLFGFYSKSL